jgi:hypothetical protein
MADAVAIKFAVQAEKAKRDLRSLGSSMGGLDKAMSSPIASTALLAGGVAAVGAAAVGAAKALISNANAVAQTGDRIAKTARIVGVTGEAYQGLQFAADRAGVAMSSVDNGLKRLSRNMLDATTGNKRMAETFEAMGISITDAVTGGLRPADDVLKDIADRVKALGPSTQVTGELMTILGRSGADMGNLLAGGSEELQRMHDRAVELGGVMSEDLLDASERYQDSLTDLSTAWQGVKNELAVGVIPVLTGLAGAFTDFLVPAAKDGVRQLRELWQVASDIAALPGQTLDFLMGKRKAGMAAPEYLGSSTDMATVGLLGTGADIIGRLSARSGRASGPSAPAASAVESAQRFAMPRIDAGAVQGSAEDAAYLALIGITKTEMDAAQEGFAAAVAADNAVRAAELQQIRENEQEKQDLYEQTRDAQYRAAAGVFDAVAGFAAMAQEAVEDSYFGQTRAGKAAAKAMFVAGKAAALATAIVNTAQAVSEANASAPAPYNVPAIVAASALGALNIGTIVGTAIQGLADGGLAPGALKAAGLNNHTVIGVRNDEAVIDPKGTSEITAMLALQRRQMEMRAIGQSANSAPMYPVIELDGRRMTRGLAPYQTAAIENGHDPRRDVRYAGAL